MRLYNLIIPLVLQCFVTVVLTRLSCNNRTYPLKTVTFLNSENVELDVVTLFNTNGTNIYCMTDMHRPFSINIGQSFKILEIGFGKWIHEKIMSVMLKNASNDHDVECTYDANIEGDRNSDFFWYECLMSQVSRPTGILADAIHVKTIYLLQAKSWFRSLGDKPWLAVRHRITGSYANARNNNCSLDGKSRNKLPADKVGVSSPVRKCPEGFFLINSYSKENLWQWTRGRLNEVSKKEQKCMMIECMEPPSIANASWQYVYNDLRHEVRYTCEEGYTMNEECVVKCNATTKKWIMSASQCKKLMIEPAKSDHSSFLFGGIVALIIIIIPLLVCANQIRKKKVNQPPEDISLKEHIYEHIAEVTEEPLYSEVQPEEPVYSDVSSAKSSQKQESDFVVYCHVKFSKNPRNEVFNKLHEETAYASIIGMK